MVERAAVISWTVLTLRTWESQGRDRQGSSWTLKFEIYALYF